MKKKMFYVLDCLLILMFMIYTLLDTFIISRKYETIDSHNNTNEVNTIQVDNDLKNDSNKTSTPIITDNSYQDENIQINIEEYRYNDTNIYVADVKVSSIDYLYAAFAQDTYGKNVTAKTSTTAKNNNAILAINGDYYGARNKGYVLRNGTLYRDTVSSTSQEDLLIYNDGSFKIVKEASLDSNTIDDDILQIFSFGPGLIIDGEIAVDSDDEVGKAKSSNPRTAICEIEPLHYLFVVSDGRTNESEGLSLLELATFLQQFDVKNAYNLDGGGSSTMVFNNQLVNNPTTSGKNVSERSVSDVICIGY